MAADYKYTVDYLKQKYKSKHPWIYWLFVIMLIIVIVMLPIVEVEVSSQSRCIVRAVEEDVQIKPVVQGRVEKVTMSINKAVKAGDTLLVVSSGQLSAQLEMQTRLLSELSARHGDLRKLCAGVRIKDSLSTFLYKSDLADFEQRLAELALRDSILHSELRRNKQGADAGVVTVYDYDQSLAEYKSVKAETEILRQQKLFEWNNARQEAEQEMTNMVGSIARLEKEMADYVIISPIDGTITEYSGLSENSFVYPGETVAVISPDDVMMVECTVLPADIAYVHVGQPVRLQFDALDYNQWGLGKAEVSDIDNNITIEQNASYFTVRCKLLSDSLSLKNGYAAPIRKGMTLTGRFTLTERSLWQLLFDKIDDWFNPKLMKS